MQISRDEQRTIAMAIGKAIESRRTQLRLSQTDLSRKTGLSRPYLSDLERGMRNISVVVLFRIARAMEVQASALLAEALKLPEPPAVQP